MSKEIMDYERDWANGRLSNIFSYLNFGCSFLPAGEEKRVEGITKSFLATTHSNVFAQFKEAENVLLCALVDYLWEESLMEEQNLVMTIELVFAGLSEYRDASCQTDLDRLFKILEEKNKNHYAIKQYKKYKKLARTNEERNAVLKSLIQRLSPLLSTEQADVFAVSFDDIMKLAYGFCSNLVNNDSGEVAMDELRVLVCQIYLVKSLPIDKQSVDALNELNNYPEIIAKKLQMPDELVKRISRKLTKISKFYREFDNIARSKPKVWSAETVLKTEYSEDTEAISVFLEKGKLIMDLPPVVFSKQEPVCIKALDEIVYDKPESARLQPTESVEKITTEMPKSRTGIIKWWSKERGYGFISIDGGSDVFIHFKETNLMPVLVEGQQVEFSASMEAIPRALNVKVIPQ